ncbi:hypothetical protein V501_05531 [Pseudogymnoascus sp. VKM F-4519 (FW-2642)]|nr:hypothetical protein V501_05531 [Pseudogymnoascus sp. VKM F-4519 (FW-2642)]
MGSEGTDIWGSPLDTPNPLPDDEQNTTSHSTVIHSPDDLSTSQHPPRSLSPTPSPSPTYPRPRSTSPDGDGDGDPDFNIELEGLKLSGGTPTIRSPAFGGGGGGSEIVSKTRKERYRDNDDEEEEDDEGPGEDLLTELPADGVYRDDDEDEGPGDDLLVSPEEK